MVSVERSWQDQDFPGRPSRTLASFAVQLHGSGFRDGILFTCLPLFHGHAAGDYSPMVHSSSRPIFAWGQPCDTGVMKTLVSLFCLPALALTAAAQIGSNSPSQTQAPARNDFSTFLRNGIQAFSGGQAQGQVSLQQVTQNWNATARDAAKRMFDKYGAPQEVTANRIVWHDNRPWKSTTVVNQDVPHNFPVEHNDVLIQVLAIDVPVERFTELAQFDGSVTASRTNGELIAACDREENNFIALNLANDLINGKVSVQQARQRLTELASAVKNGQQPNYATEIRFSLPVSTRTGDPDRAESRNQRDWQKIGW